MNQPEFDFSTKAKYNFDKLSRNNRKIFDALLRGETLNALIAIRDYRVGNLFARVHDITKCLDVSAKFITRVRTKIEDTYYINYSLSEENRNELLTNKI